MIDQTQIARARQVDLLRLVEPDTTLIHIANTRGGEYAGPCPFCGGVDRFHVVPEAGKWYCRQCAPRGGDAIDYVQRREHLAFQAAVAYLTGHTAAVGMRTRVRPIARPASSPNWTQSAWQQTAHALVQGAEVTLADEAAGAAARAYLAQRGLCPATWQTWRMGCCQAWQSARREMLPAITLPWFGADGALQAVQHRHFGPGIAQRERFGQKAGGRRLLFGLPLLAGRPTLIVTEGELNAVSCWQVAQAWADVVSIGSQENACQAGVLEALLRAALPYRQVIVWLDERERALALVDYIALCNRTAVWSADGLDANDLLQRGLLADRLVQACREPA